MVLKADETVFGDRQLKKLNIGDLVSWTEWVWEQTENAGDEGGSGVATRQTKCIGVVSELYVEDREVRKVAMAKVVPMNNNKETRLREKRMLVTSLKIISAGGYISGKKNNRVVSE